MALFDIHPLVVDKYLATILGLNEALVLQQVHYWIEINKKDKRNCHEGRYWTYNTISQWQEEFPFWSTETVKRIFKRLREANLIITDNFNVYQMDRTLWYTINYEELEKLIEEYSHTFNDSVEVVEECTRVPEGQNDTKVGSDSTNHDAQNEPMESVNMTSPLPEISIQSISLSEEENKSIDGQTNGYTTSLENFQEKYERIIENCELYAIDEKYKEAVAHAIKLLLLDVEKSKSIKIGDNFIPVEIVERDIERLNFFVIEHGVNKFKEASASTEIRNSIAYLKTCIYNSINEMKIDIDSRLRYERLIE